MGERGQGSVEYVALLAVVALLLGTAATMAIGLRNRPMASVSQPNAVREAYGRATEALVRRHAPALVPERGVLGAPVDPRTCRSAACSRGAAATLFTRVIRRGATTYVQYWAYWPDSSWHGVAGRHADDWESFQVRIGPDGTVHARASAHRGYTGRRVGPDLNLNQVDPRVVPVRWRRGWTSHRGGWRIARHSHAGFVTGAPAGGPRAWLVPLETATDLPQRYAVTPPWRKAVYADPESWAT